MSMENSFCQVGVCPWSLVTPKYHPRPEGHELEEEPSYHYIIHYYKHGLPDYSQESEQKVNQPNTSNNTRFGRGNTLNMNRDEVEVDPSEDEGTRAFITESNKAFKDKGTEACVEESINSLQRKVQSTTQEDQGQDGCF